MDSQPADASQYLTFRACGEDFALPILRVREIIEHRPITRVPGAIGWVTGVINLRGKVIPVVDLRLKFGFAQGEVTPRTCIIVVEVALAAGRVMMGIIVDHVLDVLNVVADEIEQTPQFGERVRTDYMKGVAKVKGTVKILLDLDRVLGTDDAALRAA